MIAYQQQSQFLTQFTINSSPSQQRGLCIFINIQNERVHSEEDVARVEKTFTELDYEVEVYQDVSREQLFHILEKTRMRLNSQTISAESLVVIVGAHGDAAGMQMCGGERVRAEDIVTCFLPCYCPGLKGKPKLFFFQSCRRVSESASSSVVSGEYELFQSEDVMVSLSCAFGDESYKLSKGSLYIQTLCDLLECPEWSRAPLFSLHSQLSERVREESVRLGKPEQNPVVWSGGLSKEFCFRQPCQQPSHNYSSFLTAYKPGSVSFQYSPASSNLVTNYHTIPLSSSLPSLPVPSNYSSIFSCYYCRAYHAPEQPCYHPTEPTTTPLPTNYSSLFSCHICLGSHHPSYSCFNRCFD